MAKISLTDELRHFSVPGEVRVNRHGKGKLSTKVFNSMGSFPVANCIIMGEERCAIFDAQSTMANAYRCLAEILEENLILETIYLSHAHPDHYFGVEAYMERFPEARIIAVPEETVIIPKQWKQKWESQKMVQGADMELSRTNYASPELRYPIIALENNYFELEGHRIEILPRMMGDYRYNTVGYIPEIHTIICSDCLFNEAHPFTCELDDAERAEWRDVCDRLEAMDCDVVIPGHFKHGMPLDNTAFDWNRKYIDMTELELKRCRTEAEFYYAMDRHFPNAILQKSNEMNAKVFFAGVKWDWREDEVWEEGKK